MANYFLCLCIFRIFLPIILSACVVFRPSGLSALYLLFLFYLPLVPVPTTSTMAGHTGIYLKILVVVSILTSLGQLAFQIVLVAMPPYGHFLTDCEFLEKVLRHAGFVRLDAASVITIITWLSPEVLMLATSIGTLVVCNKLALGRPVEVTEDASNLPKKAAANKKNFGILISLGKYGVLLALCLAAVLRPSVLGGLYFIIFLSASTWWACNKDLGKGFAIVMRCLMVVVVCHMAGLYVYQFEWPQEFLDRNSTYARYFALIPILSVNCTEDVRSFNWSYEEWATYVNPVALFLLYYILALESKVLLKPQSQKKQGPFSRLEGSFKGQLGRQMSQRISGRRLMRSATTKNRWQSATRKVRERKESPNAGETTPLIRGVSPSTRRYGSGKKSGAILQDSTGSVTITGDNPDDIPLDQLGKGTTEEEYKPTIFENVIYVVEALIHVIIKASYIATNIIMMAWSITYISWITFVLLLWANLLWLVPNQRKSMLRSSPFLVIYAWFLLISAYVYSMNLTDDELPSSIQGWNLSQIGFKKYPVLPCNPLLLKCFFTAMFWITLRQYMHERLAERQSSALADMVAPLQVTVGTAAGVNNDQETSGSKIMKKIGQHLKRFLTKFWIWIVAITLFGVAITGERMTAFRVLYMTLFLIFILTFQLSFRVWRKIMFGFWLTVIVYSMIILVLVYTYQFDNFQTYWEEYLHVPLQQQMDIGLEKFKAKQLFVRLVTPTVFVIITVIQLHYFHKDFMELSDFKNTSIAPVPDADESSLQGGALAITGSEKDTTSSLKIDLTDIGNISTVHVQRMCETWLKRLHSVMNLIFLFLELHMVKFVLFFAMLTCVYDKCALYLLVLTLVVFAVTTGRPMQVFAIYCSSVFVSILLLARMIYQIGYITPGNWNVTCEYGSNRSIVENNAKWFGFEKTEDGSSLSHLLKWNIIYILMVTLWAVISVRQYNYKVSRGKPPTRAFFMFPRITRSEADKNLRNCIKYLFNFGFYKFGVEICFMATVALIGTRNDIYSVIYGVWLCVLFNLERKTLANIWNFYMIFIAILLPLQYVMTVGLPPTLCILFPWDLWYWPGNARADFFRRFQEWAYLLDTEHPPNPKKLICDFVLLLLVARQSVVFRIEKRHINQEYAGGSNDSIIHQSEEKNFVNPVPDFITYVRSYLDIFKRGVLLSFLWITLAIVFLAGTNRVNVFSIGYLLGAFIFLWQGTDLYLKPIPKILKSWNSLIAYNVVVILLKTALQIIGCVFIQDLGTDFCWAIQLFGIGCVKKFGNIVSDAGIEEPSDCKVPREFVGLVWDGLCFGFLIMQRRIFQSYNFFHMIDETKAATILASRGAELIEELRIKRMSEQDEQEKKVLEKIKAKMDRIKANQQKIQGASYKDPTNHFVDTIFKGRPKGRRRQPKSYKEAIRSGDYYMFDDLDDEEIDLLDEDLKPEGDFDEDSGKSKGQTIGELLSTAMKTDIGTSLRRHSEADLKRRLSMPLARQKSLVSARSQLSAPFSAPPTIKEHEPRRSITIADGRDKKDDEDDDPQPGTSKDEDISELSEPKTVSFWQKILNYILFAWAFVESTMISLTNFLNRYSKDYRYVIRVLTKEKKILKENTEYSVGLRIGSGMVWQPAGSYHSLLRQSREGSIVMPTPSAGTYSPSDSYRIALIEDRRTSTGGHSESDEKPPVSEEDSDTKALAATLPYSPEQDRRKASVLTVPEIRILAPSLERGLDSPFSQSDAGSHMDLEEYEGTEMSSYDQPTIIRLLLAFWHIVMSRSEFLCYFIIFLDQIKSATFLSLPLPLMVFFWGTLTVPRPSKTFWVTIIAYTEIIVLIKCMFQFDIIPWNANQRIISDPFNPPRIIGIERTANYAVWDLLLLLVVFFHRFMLKTMGLWKSSAIPAVLLTEGDYRIGSQGQLEPIGKSSPKTTSHRSMSKPNGGALKSEKSSPTRRSSDLQRLVEESEDQDEDRKEEQSPPDDSANEEDSGDYENKIVSVKSDVVEPLDHFPQSLQLATSKYAESFKNFFKHLLDPTSRVAADVYSYMFLCDFFNFFVILVGYSSFGTQQGDVASYLEDNRVPILFLLMLILQFMLIVVDRGIFLRKNILAKVVFQFIQVVILHIWLFIMYPLVTERSFNSVIPPQMYYMVKCFYLLLSAYQIRCGYPTRILGNFLCKGYNYVNMFLYKAFMAIPFLFELRTIMDWMWTDTSMTVFDWIKMEDIFSHIFQLKCTRHVEDEYPQPRGEKKNPIVKYAMGGGILAVIIGIIWFPLVFFSLGNAVGKPNPPYDVTLEIRIGPYEPVYQMSAQSNSISSFTEGDLALLLNVYREDKNAISFISNYEAADIDAVKLSSYSANIWSISPPDRKRMLAEVNSTKDLTIRLEYRISHKTSKPEDSGVIVDSVEIYVPAVIDGKKNPARQNLLNILENKSNLDGDPVELTYILPKFLKVTNRGTAKTVWQLMNPVPVESAMSLRNVSLTHSSSTTSDKEWWKVNENCSDANYEKILRNIPYVDCDSLILYTFNDKIFPSSLNIITAGGIIGLYTTIVFLASRVLRGVLTGQCFKIMFEDMPNVDRVLQLCLDIYLVREAREFTLEEDLFAKLVFLFRSPETLIKWTRPAEEIGEDEDPEED